MSRLIHRLSMALALAFLLAAMLTTIGCGAPTPTEPGRQTTSAITAGEVKASAVAYAETFAVYLPGHTSCKIRGYACGATVSASVNGVTRSGTTSGPQGEVTLSGLPEGIASVLVTIPGACSQTFYLGIPTHVGSLTLNASC